MSLPSWVAKETVRPTRTSEGSFDAFAALILFLAVLSREQSPVMQKKLREVSQVRVL